MHSLDEQFDRRLPLTHRLVRTLGLLREYRGKEELYRQQMPQALETLKQAAIIQSTESSNRIEGVTAPARRIRELVAQSSQQWHRGRHPLTPWTEYLLGTLISAYREFEGRAGMIAGGRGAKTDLVVRAIGSFHGAFTVGQLQEQCPSVGIDLIRRILRDQRRAGMLECLGRGPAANWRHI